MTTNKKLTVSLIGALVLAVCACGLAYYAIIREMGAIRTVNEQAAIIAEYEGNKSNLDTSAVDNWCGDYNDGTIRLIGAVIVDDNEGLYTLEDDNGNLWEVADVCIYEDDFLLLWIADNHTPDDLTDDLIIKAWAEVH